MSFRQIIGPILAGIHSVNEMGIRIHFEPSNMSLSGRYMRLPYHGTKGHQTLGNGCTTVLNAHGHPIEHSGDLDAEMSRKKLPQMGPIKQLMG